MQRSKPTQRRRTKRRFRAEFIYPIDGLTVEEGLLGLATTFTYDGLQVEIALPVEPKAEGVEHEGERFDRFRDAYTFPLAKGTKELYPTGGIGKTGLASVDVLRLSLTWQVADFDGTIEMGERRSQADEIMRLLFDALRSRGQQAWLGLSGTRHEALRWRVFDLSGRRRYPGPAVAAQSFRVVPKEAPLTEATFGDRVADLEPTPLAEALLADAQFFKWGHLPQAAAPTILLAAIACEVHVKNVIRRTAGDKIELAEVLLSQPRDFSIAAYALFSDVIGAVTGRSLKAENPALDKAVRRLFETRNRLAHRGEVQDAKAALESLTTADAVFAWLRTFSTVSTNGTEKESS